MTLYLETKLGHRYIVHKSGDIERTDMYHVPSGSWKFRGLLSARGRGPGEFVSLEEITREWLQTHDVKNYIVCDLDHGTYRSWGESPVKITVYDSPEDTNYYKYSREQLLKSSYSR